MNFTFIKKINFNKGYEYIYELDADKKDMSLFEKEIKLCLSNQFKPYKLIKFISYKT